MNPNKVYTRNMVATRVAFKEFRTLVRNTKRSCLRNWRKDAAELPDRYGYLVEAADALTIEIIKVDWSSAAALVVVKDKDADLRDWCSNFAYEWVYFCGPFAKSRLSDCIYKWFEKRDNARHK